MSLGSTRTRGAAIGRRWVCGTALLVPIPFNVWLRAAWRRNGDGREVEERLRGQLERGRITMAKIRADYAHYWE